ncbi:carboxypeptidase-like regulatory domain-containing protein [Brumimicrobium oceani]|uniref:Carboxypeptidase regulatory-like domain-containing protein n=1 Tax=Brumimicrobium oceani TaxID=2100725 RepID=A0A2U2XE33_9FLAO|nr:carboxypeptidase-like regulatory domain-containing protein [Brumimicrobium oceani]PWH86068.1 hypothetical protein DIT68_05795 [Brumimicrobium oceani]
MKYLVVTSLLVFISLFSCKKEELDFKFSGNVKAPETGENIQNAAVKIYTYSTGDNIETLKGSTTTDASGNYDIAVERSKFETLVIRVSKKNYFIDEKTYPIDDLTTEDQNAITHFLSPKSWTKFILKKGGVTASNDHIKIQKVSGKTDCEDCCKNETKFYYGNEDLDVYCLNDGNKYMKFYWWTIGSNTSNGIDSIYNTPFDTTSFTINY